jgi:plasmid stabilization system protein ParE
VSRATVRWHVEAQDDLVELWMASQIAGAVRRAVQEVDELLRVSPSKKGRLHALSLLTAEEIDLLQERCGELPEDLQMIRCGPIEVFFIAHEADAMAIVYRVRARRDR